MGLGAGWLTTCQLCGADDCWCSIPNPGQRLTADERDEAQVDAFLVTALLDGEERDRAERLLLQDPVYGELEEEKCAGCGGASYRVPLPANLAHYDGHCIVFAREFRCSKGARTA